ncbi:hypothetical protein ACXWR7_12280, partial [Streptococcus pyogenes]
VPWISMLSFFLFSFFLSLSSPLLPPFPLLPSSLSSLFLSPFLLSLSSPLLFLSSFSPPFFSPSSPSFLFFPFFSLFFLLPF